MHLVVKYWASREPDPKIGDWVVVGDVHGDLHQFLAPLVLGGIIKLSGKLKTISEELAFYVPEYELVEPCDKKVIYLGDLVDEWIFSRTIVRMMKELLLAKRVILLYGNHDTSLIGKCRLFRDGCLDLRLDVPALYVTVKNELSHRETRSKIDDQDYVRKYVQPLFDDLSEIFERRLGRVGLLVKIVVLGREREYLLSHTTWNWDSLGELVFKGLYDREQQLPEQVKRPFENNPLILEKCGQHVCSEKSLGIVRTAVKDIRSGHPMRCSLEELVDAVNDIYHGQSNKYVSFNKLTRTRYTDGVFLNQMVGHTIGGYSRELGVNTSPATYRDERNKKLTGEEINGKRVYYFDFGCSAGYDHDELSRPDFVYTRLDGMYVTNLPGFQYVKNEKDQDVMMILEDKSVNGKKISFN